MKQIGSILALVAALVLVLHFVIDSPEMGNVMLYIAIIFMVAAVLTPIIMNAINNRK